MQSGKEIFGMRVESQTQGLCELPEETLQAIAKYLSVVDRQNLGSVSRGMHPLFQPKLLLDKFLQGIAYGMQDKVEQLFTDIYARDAAKIQEALRYRGGFTDYSGRTFNCSAYEYAYWAKDTHMCRMLQQYMDHETKAQMLTLIDAIEARGLIYQQKGEEHQSAHFDFKPLKEAYQLYLAGFHEWFFAKNLDAIGAAWLDVGKAQRNVPAHVAQEYCRPDRGFYPCPSFNEPILPRALTFYESNTELSGVFFPQPPSNSGLPRALTPYKSNTELRGVFFPQPSSNSGLGSDFGVCRAWRARATLPTLVEGRVWYVASQDALRDHAAINKLDEVRTAQLTQLHEHLHLAAALHRLSR